MGIVVTVFMLLGLLMILSLSLRSLAWLSLVQCRNTQLANVIGFGLLFAGSWNRL